MFGGIYKFKEELNKIRKVKDIKTSYIDGKLNYEILAIHNELGEVILKFSALFDISEIRIDEYGMCGGFAQKYIKSDIRNIIVANDEGSLFTIEQVTKDMTIEEIEKELRYKINIIK